MPSLYRRALAIYRHHGLGSVLWRAAVKALAPLGRLELALLYRMDLHCALPVIRAGVPVMLRHAGAHDIAALAAIMVRSGDAGQRNARETARRVGERLHKGHVCFLAFAEGAIVHYNWLSFGWKESLAGRFIVLEADAAYCGGGYTAEGWRGRGIHAEVNAAMLRHLQAKGYRRAYTFVHAENRSSLKGLKRVGWTRSGVVVAFTSRGARKAWVLRLSGSAHPFLALRPPQPVSEMP